MNRKGFKGSGSLTFTGQTTPFATYTYNISTGNLNGRTLQDFSTNAEALMWNCSGGCPYDDFRKYVNYYGVPSYGDEFIMSAFNGTSTNFLNGDADFGLNYTRGGRGGKHHNIQMQKHRCILISHFASVLKRPSPVGLFS
jgi:hypothetical protein